MKKIAVVLAAMSCLILSGSSAVSAPSATTAAPAAPVGLTGMADDHAVQLGWQPVVGASGYTVYRGTTITNVTTRLTTASGTPATTYSDSTAVNGTTYYYLVRAVAGGIESTDSLIAQSKPVAVTCASTNPVVVENCHAGDTTWRTVDPGRVSSGGIEGFADAASINHGDSVNVRVNSGAATTFRIEIYRSGYYGGAGGRLFSVIRNVPGVPQPSCNSDSATGLVDCSNWAPSATVTTSPSWPSGIYILRVVRTDNGSDNEILLVLRDDARNTDVLYGAGFSTYQSYNNYGGKSLYDFNSIGSPTVSGSARAVKVSFDRPFEQPRSGDNTDWYDKSDYPFVFWMERSGYSVSYIANTDLDAQPSLARNHKAYISPAHDEYVSAGMRSALQQARDAGVGLFFSGSNTMFWKVRYEANPYSGKAGRVQVCYKTTQGGPADPSGTPTGLWRDPNGANQPENGLVGQAYAGDADYSVFPMVISAAEGKDRIWRYTNLGAQAPGDSTSLNGLIGWEWDKRMSNGFEPAGVVTLATSAVTGNIFSSPYASTPGGTTITAVKYIAPSGALVFSAGTNFWARGLALNVDGAGSIHTEIQQATTNILGDMGALPQTPAPDIQLDAVGPAQVIGTNPSDGAIGVPRTTTVVATFSRALDPASVTTSTFTLTRPDGTPVPAAVSLSGSTATLTPNSPLAWSTTYTGHLSTSIKTTDGQALAAPLVWSFTTDGGIPPTVSLIAPGANATAIAPSIQPHATFSRTLDPATVTTSSFVLTAANGSTVSATVGYDAASGTATLAPVTALALGATYTVKLTTAIQAADGVPLAAPMQWSFTTASIPPTPPTVTAQAPAPQATGVARTTIVTATFSKDMDPTSLTATAFTLTPSGGAAVAASVSYDSTSKTATLAPVSPLAPSSSYAAKITTAARAADGTPLAAAVTWSFATAAPLPPPTVTDKTPSDASTGVVRGTSVTATFSRSLDPSSITSASFTLTASGSTTPVAASVAYDAATRTATLQPTGPLNSSTTYTARLDASVAGSDGVTMTAPVVWSFTTGLCPCQLFSALTIPASTGNSTQDSRTGTGPFTYELGLKIKVDRAMQVNVINFYKSPGETGTHIGRIWTAGGLLLGTVTFSGETASGWQQQALTDPLILYPNATYVVSVNANSKYALTVGGLVTQIDSGALHSIADGANGVFGSAAGTFPTSSWNSSNYFIDVSVVDAKLAAPTVTARAPGAGSSNSSIHGLVTATFSRSMDPSSLTASTFTLRTSGGTAVPATVSYDDSTLTATLVPSAPLSQSTTYTATIAGTAQASDLTPLGNVETWSFTTASAPPPAPTVSGTSPASGAGPVDVTSVTATFSKAMAGNSINATTFTLAPVGGPTVPATVTYNATTNTATLTPTTSLARSTQYVATLTTGLRAADGAPLANNFTWQFTTATCPCSLFSSVLTPATVRNPTDDGRSGAGPFSYELGAKITVAQPMNLTAVRFYKSPGETGSHIGRIWAAGGLLLATVTFSGETASGWQQQALATPVELQTGGVYVISVNANAYYVATQNGLLTQASNGPLQSVADGLNGIYGASAGTFPNKSYKSSNYFVDVLAVPNGSPTPLTVSGQTPAPNATDVSWLGTITATFSRGVNPATVTPATFTLSGPGGPVVASVSYNAATNTATLTPAAQLGFATTYTASLSSGVLAADGQPLTPGVWSFLTAPQPAAAFTVASTSPTSAAIGSTRDTTVTAIFNRSADPSTVTAANFVLKDAAGTAVPATVAYDNPSTTATLRPSALLSPRTTYTATLSSAVRGSDGAALTDTVWTFTTGDCPCTLFPASLAPTSTGNPVDDGRTGPGPFSYEMGVKISVTRASTVSAIRFYKSPGETGTHIGRIWTASGTQLAQVTFSSETSSGWQQQQLSTPLSLSANTVYIVSVGINKFYVVTGSGLAAQVTSGPLQSVADGLNGVFGSSAGTFPTSSYRSGNYFVDADVR